MSETPFLKSTLRLFLSVDIVGSTAFKQGKVAGQRGEKAKSDSEDVVARPAEAWFSPIVEFYREIERLFSKEWLHYTNVISQNNQWPTGPSPEFWKGAGDELIYTKELEDHREALVCLQTWIKVVNAYRKTFKSKYPSLDLKCAAWVAGFPVHNSEVFFRSSFSAGQPDEYDDAIYSNMELMKTHWENPADKNIIRDFIGPSMDTGFRLASLASSRKLIVSVDLALLLVHAARTQEGDFGYAPITFHYDGRVALKGVLGGTPYPVFWIDMAEDDPLNQAEDDLARVKAADSDRVKRFCEAFITQHSTFVFRPYIVGNAEPFFSNMPLHHKDRLDGLQSYWQRERDRRAEERASAESSGDLNEDTNAAEPTWDKLVEMLLSQSSASARFAEIKKGASRKHMTAPMPSGKKVKAEKRTKPKSKPRKDA